MDDAAARGGSPRGGSHGQEKLESARERRMATLVVEARRTRPPLHSLSLTALPFAAAALDSHRSPTPTMNRFLTRRKDGDDHGKKSKKGKKNQPEPKVEVDLKIVLPSTDDFRTSLIMPSLSTRFSMLREQDDPNTKLGKASDDSVLQPKRQSRLHEFGFVPGGLADIAEVSSLHGSIRPPFAEQRQDSFDSQAVSDDGGSMMSRARPGEGNNMFGGRQRVYKIAPGNSSGRALYEDDIHMSTFQKMRMEEKQRALQEFDFGGDKPDENVQSDDTAYSPVSGYSQRRETSSSTNSGPANTRTSTAATSIASQGANSIPVSSPALPSSVTPLSPTQEIGRSTTKGRRLYDQGLDKHIYDQQSSALNRLNSIQRTQVPTGRSTPPLFTQTRSATNLNDRFNRVGPLRTDSPTTMGSHAAFNSKDPQSTSSSPIISRPQSPPLTSPLGSDSEDAQTLNSALQPNDRGKATAMGAFNKPKQAFSEQQYAERLRQMQQEREGPPPKVPEKSRKLTLRERAELEQRKRAETGNPPQNASPEQKQAPSAFSVFQMAANQMKNAPSTTLPSPPKQQESQPQESARDSQHGATFFASPGSSDDEDETPKRNPHMPADLQRRLENIPTIPASNLPTASKNGRPAFRSRTKSRPDDLDHPALRSRSNSRPPVPLMHNEPVPTVEREEPHLSEEPGVDSPTLGPDNGGLGGLIRQHLRTASNVSSDYGDANQIAFSPPPTQATAPLSLRTRDVPTRKPHSESDTPAPSTYSHSNPWDLDDLDNSYRGEGDSISSVSPVDAYKPKLLAQQPSQGQSRADYDEPAPDWEKDLKKSHTRGFSNETQNEEEALQREFAQRQRAIIQETLASQEQSRSGSPAPAAPGGLKVALNMLRAVSSRESFATVEAHRQQETPSKAMRMLGISENSSSTSLLGSNDRSHGSESRRSDEDRSGHLPQLRSKPSRMLEQSEQDARREFESRVPRSIPDDSNRDARPKGRTPPASSRSSTRDRSSSEVSSGRSRSRPGQYRDDLEQAMTEGRSTIYPPNTAPSMPGYVANATQPLPTDRPPIDAQPVKMRSRSNSRVAGPTYLEPKHLQPIYTGNGIGNGMSPRLSPAANTPHGLISPGLPASPRPSPGAPSPSMNGFRPPMSPMAPFSAHNTPPVSGQNTPVLPSYNFPASAPLNKTNTMRKKSIAKADISEPIFVSGTSVMDTVDLPAGASLKNGMDTPPPLPPINPMRRRFGFGRAETHDPSTVSPKLPFAESLKTSSTEALPSQIPTRNRLRKSSSEGKSLHGKAQIQTGPSPAMPQGPFSPRAAKGGSPPRPINSRPAPQRPMDGAMF
ncbi:hypothetical protein P154DRAFT_615022 [Amniculicola lignicola CBS 123094]|uniref:Uncharacterized protein n=1 Tax=Amniculicola lignicola CBS 123094 TaxID=1392246 RepID=A0A6A5X2Y0_9PLEO|nr:hypothetical protein P154DRAFT_615022 [Amniculicola lignicola CBS 123094]